MELCLGCKRAVFKINDGLCSQCVKSSHLPKGCAYCRSYIAKDKVYCSNECMDNEINHKLDILNRQQEYQGYQTN